MVLFGAWSLKHLGFPGKTKLNNLIDKLDRSSKRKLAFHQIVFSHDTSTIASKIKVKETEKDIGLTKNYYIAITIQKISSIHKFLLKIKQTLGSQGTKRPCPWKKLVTNVTTKTYFECLIN